MKRKLIFFVFLIILSFLKTNAQSTTELGPGGYKTIFIGYNGFGDYTQSLILLHEIYNGTNINPNYAIGTIQAKRGHMYAYNRLSVVELKSSSAYNSTNATVHSFTTDQIWQLKTCIFESKKYLALKVPYSPAYYNDGFFFTGWTTSTAENMKCVAYQVNGQPVNQNVISDIQDYNGGGLTEDLVTSGMRITGPVAIGTTNLDYTLNVNGTAHAKEVKVDLLGWSDFVFKPEYQLQDLQSLKQYIQENQHLPDIPNEVEVMKNGILLGEMNKKLLQKVEELTLHLIKKDDQLKDYAKKMQSLEQRLAKLEAIKD